MRTAHRPYAFAIALTLLGACGGETTTPPTATPPATPPGPVVPPGMVMVTVSAASTPAGATVTGGGTLLGTTPFVTPVPVPAPTAGETQTFEFTFQLPGYQPTTVTASPVNNTINLNAVLAPMVAAVPPTPPGMPPATPPLGVIPGTPGAPPVPVSGVVPPGTTFRVESGPGGPIYDNHTTTASATVAGNCRIGALRVDINGNHTFHSDLVVRLVAPDGEAFSLQNHARRNPFRTHTVTRARGRMAGGVWTLSVADTVGADSGTLRGFSLEITCS